MAADEMQELEPYRSAILALGVFGILYLLQLIVADLVGASRKHTPGTPITGDHDDLLFRAARAHANTTESVGAVILIAGFAIAAGGDPSWVSGSLWAVVALRFLHTFAYYLDLRMLRTIAFALSLVALLVLFVAGLVAQ